MNHGKFQKLGKRKDRPAKEEELFKQLYEVSALYAAASRPRSTARDPTAYKAMKQEHSRKKVAKPHLCTLCHPVDKEGV